MEASGEVPRLSNQELFELLKGSAPFIHRHSAVIIVEGDRTFSGVYAKFHGYYGILTAGHCAKDFMSGERFGLVVSESMHQFWADPASFEHITIGDDENGDYSLDGPDLSFALIKDHRLLAALFAKDIKFYEILFDNVNRIDFRNIDTRSWCVSGNPKENVAVSFGLLNGNAAKMVNTTAAVIQGFFQNYEEKGGHDYISLSIGSAFEEFPVDYDGVSGGGIWYQKLVLFEKKTLAIEPVLAGITCWQSAPTDQQGWTIRRITGHCITSVYGHMRRLLREKWTLEQQSRG